ncbi:MAG: tetratricopeptide repeat protein [Pseudomonadota bacterium]
MSFFEELKRRNVIRVGFAYLVASWLAIQVAETLFPVYGLSDDAIRLVVTVAALGFLPVLFLSWVFERTSDGIKRQKDVDRDASITQATGRQLDRLIIVVLALALGYFAVDKFLLREAPTAPILTDERSPALEDWENRTVAEDRKAIAVLPFANMSGDPANEPFTLGIHDDLLTHLSRIGALKTTSRTSVLQYRGTTKPVPEIGAELNVNFILEGGIQRSGDRVRINLQLIDVATDEHLWAEIYDRELTAENLFSVQADVAEEVTRSLEATLLPEEQVALAEAPTASMAAYDLYILGRHHQHTRTEEALTRSVEYFEQAIAEDPDYVLAYAGLAQSLVLLIDYGNLSGAEVMPAVREYVDTAMALDPERSEVWATEGLYWLQTADNPRSIEALERAIELDIQNYHAWLWYGNSLLRARRFTEQLEALEVAYSLEPMSQPVNNNLAGTYQQRGDFTRSRQHWERVDRIDDENPTEFRERIAWTYVQEGDFTNAMITGREILAQDPYNGDAMGMLTNAYVDMGDLAEARIWAERQEDIESLATPFYWYYVAREDFDGLQRYLEDKRAMIQADGDELLFSLFQAAYLGGQTESARDYLDRFLATRGGRLEVFPSDTWQWNPLLVASFLIEHGEDSPGSVAQGREMVGEVMKGLLALNAQGFVHPSTWMGLAMGHVLSGDKPAALTALARAVDAGFSSRLRLEFWPMFDPLRTEPAFADLLDRIDTRMADASQKLARARLAAYTPAGKRERIALPREVLDRYLGYYTDGNFLFHLYIDEATGEIMGKPGPQMAMVLVPYAENAFYPEIAQSVSIEVILDDEGRISHVEVNDSGSVQRLKVAAAPPPTIVLSESEWSPMLGSWTAELVEGTVDGTADTDLWTAVISLDESGQPWIDFDNQPALPIAAVDERSFIVPNFIQRFTLIPGDAGDRLIMNQDGIELVFERD